MYERIMKWTAGITLALVLFGVTHPALAQTATECSASQPWNAYCLRWTAPTTYTSGAPITAQMTYRVEQRLGTTGAWTAVVSNVSITRAYITSLAPGTYFFRVYANCTGCTESVASEPSPGNPIVQPAPPQPNPPVIIVSVTIAQGAPPTAVQVNGTQVYANRP